MDELHRVLESARSRARYSQDDVGAALGVSRAMVSYWETGSRLPNDRQLGALARLYGLEPAALIEGRDVAPAGGDLAGVLLRADDGLAEGVTRGIREFVAFLEQYARLSAMLQKPIRGLFQSPFVHRSKFAQKDDIRRKAEEVRWHLGLGIGPIYDLDPVCERLGVTVYRAPLGRDLREAPSGAFLNHPDVGFSILVNLDMTPGRRCFTLAHELAHALFHSNDTNRVVSRGEGPLETFADAFAGEFLMPSEGVRRLVEESGMPPRIVDSVDIIHIQRYFRVSWPTALVRLRQMNTITAGTYDTLKRSVRPVSLAQALGYEIHPEERVQDADLWSIHRFPQPFLRMLREAVAADVMSPPSAASFLGVALPDMLRILGESATGAESESPQLEAEFSEFEETGVI